MSLIDVLVGLAALAIILGAFKLVLFRSRPGTRGQFTGGGNGGDDETPKGPPAAE